MRLGYSNTISTLALLVALSGGAVAAASALITGADVKDGSLSGLDIRNQSLSGLDIKDGSLSSAAFSPAARTNLRGGTGSPGAKGDPGAAGPPGPALLCRHRAFEPDGQDPRIVSALEFAQLTTGAAQLYLYGRLFYHDVLGTGIEHKTGYLVVLGQNLQIFLQVPSRQKYTYAD